MFFSTKNKKGIPKEQGIRAFWRGNGINLISIIPKTIVQFTFYENIKKFFMNNGEQSYEVLIYQFFSLKKSFLISFLFILSNFYEIIK